MSSKPQPASPPEDGVEYQSVRIIGDVHKLRFGAGARLVESGPGQTIVFRKEPYPHFHVLPAGVEIPLHNTASAIAMSAGLASKLRKTGQTGARVVKPVPGVGDPDDAG